MHTYTPQTFDIPELKDISRKQIDLHIGLYEGYVKHVNLIREKIHEFETEDAEKHAYAIAELRRRFSFEFNGMRMHEYYFGQLEGGAKELPADSALKEVVSEKYGSFDKFLAHFKTVATMRGTGWAILYYDPKGKTPHVAWVSSHEIGQLGSLPVILPIDMWEHAYMADYMPAEKGKHVDAFLSNINWETVEKRLKEVL